MRILNYFREKNQVIGELERVKKGKRQVEEKFDEMIIDLVQSKDKIINLQSYENDKLKENIELTSKVKEYKKILAEEREESKRMIESLQTTIATWEKENNKLNKQLKGN